MRLAALLAPFNHVLFTLGADHVSVAELLGFLTGALCVWLTVRLHIANFPVGIANSAFFLLLFLTARLYADSALQVVYLVLGFAGWWQWLHGGARRSRLEVGRAPAWTRTALAVLTAVATAGLTVLLRAAHDVAPFWDALTTSLSLAAQWLLNTKKVENWLVWMVADLVYIPLYAAKHLYLTALVYAAFLGLTVLGLRAWRQALPALEPPARPMPARPVPEPEPEPEAAR